MYRRITLAALLIGFLAASANAQKDKPKLTSVLTWETIDADSAGKTTIKRASLPDGWLLLVQNGDEITVRFLSDKHHEWGQASPSDNKPPKGSDKPKFEDITKATLERVYQADLEQARATVLVEQAKAEAVQKKLEQELRKLRAELEKMKKAKKPKKDEKGDKEADRQRISEALGLAAREESQKAKATVEQARAQEAAARQEAAALKEKLEAVAKEFQKQLAETAKALEEARTAEKRAAVEAASAMEDNRRLKTETDLLKKDNDRLRRRLLDLRK